MFYKTLKWCFIGMICAGHSLGFSVSAFADVISDYSNFTESGNMLNSAVHNREQDFDVNPVAIDGPTITITHDSVTTGTASQEIFGTSEFTPFTTLGYRLQVDLTTIDFEEPGTGFNERVGLVTASTVPAGGPSSGDVRTAGDYFYWVYRGDPGVVMAGMYTSGGIEEEAGLISVGAVGTDITGLYMERVNDISNGDSWDLGYIDENGEDVFVQNRATINGETITTDGSVIGLYSDMRDNASEFTLQNLSYTFIPPGDFNKDGTTDGIDFLKWQQDPAVETFNEWKEGFGSPPPLSTLQGSLFLTVPEPNTLVLLGLGGFALLIRRKSS